RLNPVSIRVSYEVEGGGDRFWTWGAGARLAPLRRVVVGGSFVKDEDPLDEHRLGSAGARLQLLPRSFLTAEWARSDSANGSAGDAWRGEATALGDRFDLRGFAVRTDAGFANPSAGLTAGRDELGGNGHLR